jgi:hypothetical protein
MGPTAPFGAEFHTSAACLNQSLTSFGNSLLTTIVFLNGSGQPVSSMSVEPGSFESPKYNYEAIEAAVRETERGRWFLTEHDRRSRSSEIRSVLDAIGKFESLIRAVPESQAAPQLNQPLAEAIAKTKADIEAAAIKVFPLPVATMRSGAFGYLAVQARAIAAELAQLGQVMQLTAESFRDDQEGMTGAVNHLSQRLLDIAGLQSALTAGVDKAMSLLDRLDRESAGEREAASFTSRLEVLAVNLPRMRAELSEENCRYFGKDEELFAHEEKVEPTTPPVPEPMPANPPAPVAAQGAKARIVVVRTPSTSAMPIPLAGSTQETAA